MFCRFNTRSCRLVIFLTPALLLFFSPVNTKAQRPWLEGQVQQQVYAITQVMMHDVTDPAAAARFYAYSVLTGYEIVCQQEQRLPRFQRAFRNYPVKDYHPGNSVDIEFSALYGILETGKAVLPSGYRLEENQKQLYQLFLMHQVPRDRLDSSAAFARKISRQVVDFGNQDGYFKLSTLPRYKPMNTDTAWQPTPPEYMAAVQPHWSILRPFFLDSATQFKPKPLVPFDTAKTSPFFQLAMDVYRAGKNLTTTQRLIANFWDCNPFAVQFQGHMSIGLKKISPGGHWMGITGTVCQQKKLGIDSTLFLYTVVALAVHDAFISCWTEKYRTNRIRPETVINRFIDEKWQPELQTPPFPEYTSGHSVVSTTAATVLTHYLGDHLAFTDSTETYIGLPPRKFSSFMQASDEACISRFYGGIHYMDSINYGRDEGIAIGLFVISRLDR
ncbi:MAG TPA: vanadium-dependent haloperoxidase [Puia sp.]|nr:vanadium-dependent haloperoxidase [Puia sp.]